MDIEAVVLSFVRILVKQYAFRLPIHVASVAPNGSVLFTRFTSPPPPSKPGAVTLEHVTGNLEDEGFLTPFYMLATDATGRAKTGVKRSAGDPVVLDFADEDDG
jgi:hypothetical protein